MFDTDASDHEIEALFHDATQAVDPRRREEAEDRIVRLFLPLARRLALRYRNRGADDDDLVAVANLALVKAVRGYRTDRGHFAPYASATILGEIKRHFRDHCWMIRPTRPVQDLQAQIRGAQEALGRTGRAVSPAALSEHLDADESAVREALNASHHFTPASIDEPIGTSGMVVADRVADTDDPYEAVDDLLTLVRHCQDLTDDERELLRLRFVEERTQSEVAALIGVSQMQVSRRQKALLEKLRAISEAARVA